MGVTRGSLTRGSLTLPRMGAHRPVIVAAALSTVAAAALGAALATFNGQALPRAVRHDLGAAAGTPLVISGAVSAGQAARYDSLLPARISSALRGTPFAFYRAAWSDPFGFVAGPPPAGAVCAVCAVVLPRAVGSSIDLSAFTGTSIPVQFQFDAAALALPAAAVGVLALAALAGQARALRRRGVTGVLRLD